MAALGDRAWEDTNANGVQDDGEPGLAGVAVELYTCDGTFVAATVTDANGYYLFSSLTPGSYYVKFVTPGGYIITPANVGDDAFDSDIDGNGATTCTELSSGETDLTVDAGFYKPTGQMCTLTPGYWKTHSGYGPAPYDDTWAMIGEDTAFFQSGQSWYQVLWTSPSGGNAYYILAHAYIAAYLNGLNGADTSAVAGELSLAQSLLGAYGPNDRLSRSVRQQFLDTAGVLDQYNNGYIGPGHCE
jgi:hypothetical protein